MNNRRGVVTAFTTACAIGGGGGGGGAEGSREPLQIDGIREIEWGQEQPNQNERMNQHRHDYADRATLGTGGTHLQQGFGEQVVRARRRRDWNCRPGGTANSRIPCNLGSEKGLLDCRILFCLCRGHQIGSHFIDLRPMRKLSLQGVFICGDTGH